MSEPLDLEAIARVLDDNDPEGGVTPDFGYEDNPPLHFWYPQAQALLDLFTGGAELEAAPRAVTSPTREEAVALVEDIEAAVLMTLKPEFWPELRARLEAALLPQPAPETASREELADAWDACMDAVEESAGRGFPIENPYRLAVPEIGDKTDG